MQALGVMKIVKCLPFDLNKLVHFIQVINNNGMRFL